MQRPGFIARQSRCPSGLLGWLLGCIMDIETAPENDATLQRLDLQPDDRVLEIGFGPGRALEHVAGVVTTGMVAGIDVSEEMIAMARRRCERHGRRGRLELRLGSADRLPFGDASFDKVYSVHTIYFWDRPATAFAEIRRVLKPDGVLVLCFRPRGAAGTEDFPADVYRFYGTDEISRLLQDGGFREIDMREADPSRGIVIARAHVR